MNSICFPSARICTRLLRFAAEQRNGIVHSVFQSALNTVCGEKLITVLSGDMHHVTPYSILLSKAVNFTTSGFEPGMTVDFSAQNIVVHSVEEEKVFSLNTALKFDCSIYSLSGLYRPANFQQKVDTLSSIFVHTDSNEKGIVPLLSVVFPDFPVSLSQNQYTQHLMLSVRFLTEMLVNEDYEYAEEIGKQFAGCGPGLSPSSDDFLIGLFAVLSASQMIQFKRTDSVQRLIDGLATGAVKSTSLISAAYLRYAAEGLFSESILKLIAILFSDCSIKSLLSAASDVCAYGATSRVDMLAGFYFGLKLIDSVGCGKPTRETVFDALHNYTTS